MTGNLQQLYTLDDARTYRVSSWDKAGKNNDFLVLQPGASYTLAELTGPGCIKHLYCTMINRSRLMYRKLILRIWWDDEQEPSVEVPLGDFFCISHCTVRPVASQVMTINPGWSYFYTHGLNCYLPMPFRKNARVAIEYQATGEGDEVPSPFWYHIDAEQYPAAPRENFGHFHAQWRRENFTRTTDEKFRNQTLWPGTNLDGKENYVILEAAGKGQIVGLHLQVDNIAGGWYGEGNDQIFIDGEQWPPSYPGTGSEEVFGGGACPNVEYSAPFTGFHLISGDTFRGKTGMYRWYINDPVKFQRSVRMTIEHGHANNFENDYSSVAYWYQTEPHAAFPRLLPAAERVPHFPPAFFEAERKIARINNFQKELEAQKGPSAARHISRSLRFFADKLLRDDNFEDACLELDRIITMLSS